MSVYLFDYYLPMLGYKAECKNLEIRYVSGETAPDLQKSEQSQDMLQTFLVQVCSRSLHLNTKKMASNFWH